MTQAAQVARIGQSHPRPGTTSANEPRYPTHPQIKTKADKFIALAAWAVGPIVVIGAVALVVLFFKH